MKRLILAALIAAGGVLIQGAGTTTADESMTFGKLISSITIRLTLWHLCPPP